jgi:cytochrome c-type biogenesis protein CcmH/NrfG
MVPAPRHRRRLSPGTNCVTMKPLMEQRRIISVVFLVIVVAMALLLYAQYNRPSAPAAPAAPTGEVSLRPLSVG